MRPIIDERDLIEFRQLPEVLPGRPALKTVYLWLRGLNGVKLDSLLIGGRRFVRRSAVERFIEQRSEQPPIPRRRKASGKCG